MENTKKQSTHILHFQNFVTEIFAKRFERFSICWKKWILAILHPKMNPHTGGCGKKEGHVSYAASYATSYAVSYVLAMILAYVRIIQVHW